MTTKKQTRINHFKKSASNAYNSQDTDTASNKIFAKRLESFIDNVSHKLSHADLVEFGKLLGSHSMYRLEAGMFLGADNMLRPEDSPFRKGLIIRFNRLQKRKAA